MATYIPNVTDTFPQIQPFKPDYSFLQSALQYKQSRYDAGFNQLNSIYGSILNSPLTSGLNQERRNEFMKAADAELKKVSALDLSLPQNVQLASNVFKPFYEDENIIYDLMFTKKARQSLSDGEQLKGTDKYSPISLQAINYKIKEFEAADDAGAKKITAPDYVPYVNIIAEAEKQLGEKFTDISIDEKSGGYIVTTKNGPKAFNVILQQLSSTLGVDPNVRQYARTEAYVNSMNEIVPLAQSNYNGNINQAKAEYYSTYSEAMVTNDKSKTVLIKKSLDDAESKLDMYNAKLSGGGRLNEKQTAEYQQLSKLKGIYSETLESTENRIRVIQDAIMSGDFQTLENAGIQSMAASSIGNKINEAANIQAYKKYEVKMNADPYEKSKFDKALDWSYKQMEKELDFQYKMKEKELTEGEYDEFYPQATTTQAGQSAMENVERDDRTVYNQTWKTYSNDLTSVIKSGMNINNENIKSSLSKMLSSEGITLKDLESGNLGSTKLRSLHIKINDLFSKYPELNSAISSPLAKANDSRQMLNATDVTIAKNNKAVVNNMVADKSTSVADRELLNVMFENSGRLKDKNTAYNEYVSKNGTQKLRALKNNSFVGRGLEDIQSLVGLNSTPKEIFDEMYDNAKEEFDEKYTNYAINTKSYMPAGGIGLGGGGGITTDYMISGIADASRKKSKQTLALYDITSNLQGAKIALGSPETVRQESDDDFEDVKSNTALSSYVNNLRMIMRMNDKIPVGYSFSSLGLGSKNYGTLHIKPSSNDPALKALFESKSINEGEYTKLQSEGITVIIPKANLSNTFLGSKTSVNNREVILKSTGSYNYYNPKISADITFTLNQDGSVVPSGTMINTKTNKLNFVPTNPIDFATFNAMLFGLDKYK